MNESPQEVRINKVEPVGIKYPSMTKHSGYKAQRHLTSFNAENASTFTESNNICRIPCSSGSFLDLNQAVLGFQLKNSSSQTNSLQLDDCASSVISRVRILNMQGGELERLENYSLLSSKLNQYTRDFNTLVSEGVGDGSPWRYDFTPKQNATITANATVTTETGMVLTVGGVANATMVYANTRGGRGYNQEQADILNQGKSRHYEIKLKGAWFNPDHKNYLPPQSSFILELQFASVSNAFRWSANHAGNTYEVSNCILNVPAVNITDSDLLNRMNLSNRSISWTGTSFSHVINTTQNAPSGTENLQLSIRAFVLKGLMSIMRVQADINSQVKYSNSKTTIQGLVNYSYQLGSQNYPQQQVDINLDDSDADLSTGGTAVNVRILDGSKDAINISEASAEIKRLIRGLKGDLSGHGIINDESYGQSINNNGSGMIGVSLEPYGHDEAIHNGIDTASSALPVSLRLGKSDVNNVVCQIDTYGICQVVFMRDSDGSLTSEF